MMNDIIIRAFIKTDWTSVSRIYTEGLQTGLATFETEIPSWDVWNAKFHKQCRLVAVNNDEVVGFAMLSKVSQRKVYKGVAEVTIYIAHDERGKNFGNYLLRALIDESESHGFWTLQAGVFSENIASISLHEKCGFRVVGTREKIGQLKGVWHDNVLLERRSKNI